MLCQLSYGEALVVSVHRWRPSYTPKLKNFETDRAKICAPSILRLLQPGKGHAQHKDKAEHSDLTMSQQRAQAGDCKAHARHMLALPALLGMHSPQRAGSADASAGIWLTQRKRCIQPLRAHTPSTEWR